MTMFVYVNQLRIVFFEVYRYCRKRTWEEGIFVGDSRWNSHEICMRRRDEVPIVRPHDVTLKVTAGRVLLELEEATNHI